MLQQSNKVLINLQPEPGTLIRTFYSNRLQYLPLYSSQPLSPSAGPIGKNFIGRVQDRLLLHNTMVPVQLQSVMPGGGSKFHAKTPVAGSG